MLSQGWHKSEEHSLFPTAVEPHQFGDGASFYISLYNAHFCPSMGPYALFKCPDFVIGPFTVEVARLVRAPLSNPIQQRTFVK